MPFAWLHVFLLLAISNDHPIPPEAVHAALEPTLALAGLTGVTIFAVGQAVARRRPALHSISARFTHAALFLGLAIWTILFLLRHDMVTVVGLLLAMALLHRRNRALVGKAENSAFPVPNTDRTKNDNRPLPLVAQDTKAAK